jgi:hypothetical protein
MCFRSIFYVIYVHYTSTYIHVDSIAHVESCSLITDVASVCRADIANSGPSPIALRAYVYTHLRRSHETLKLPIKGKSHRLIVVTGRFTGSQFLRP